MIGFEQKDVNVQNVDGSCLEFDFYMLLASTSVITDSREWKVKEKEEA